MSSLNDDDRLTEPALLAEHLDFEHGVLNEEVLLLLQIDEEDTRSGDRFRRKLRKPWFLARNRAEVLEYKRAFDGKRFSTTNQEVAAELSLSAAAIGGWFNKQKGIDPENIELLRRCFPDVVVIARPTEHELDLSGFMAATEQLKCDHHQEFLSLSELDFFRLWFLFRNRLWYEAVQTKSASLKQNAANEINLDVRHVTLALDEFRTRRRVEYVQPEEYDEGRENSTTDASVAQLEQLAHTWGPWYAAVVDYLGEICWTAPNAT